DRSRIAQIYLLLVRFGLQRIPRRMSRALAKWYPAPLGKRATNSTRSRDLARWQMADEQHSEEVQRWTAKRRAALVLSLLKGETTAADAARRHGLTVAEVEEWRERFLLGAENALRARPKEEDALREEEVNRLKRKVGELTMDLDILRVAAKRPTTPGTSEE